ncbi:MAG: cytidine deaminase [Treponemataceae bacterium]
MKNEDLFKIAFDIAPSAYAPYSQFPVGAAILLSDGKVITGVNIENRSFGLTNCAERTALFTAVAQGHTDFRCIAIATPAADYPVSPCGACRQVLSEFMKPDVTVIFGQNWASHIETTLKELYPYDALHELKK